MVIKENSSEFLKRFEKEEILDFKIESSLNKNYEEILQIHITLPPQSVKALRVCENGWQSWSSCTYKKITDASSPGKTILINRTHPDSFKAGFGYTKGGIVSEQFTIVSGFPNNKSILIGGLSNNLWTRFYITYSKDIVTVRCVVQTEGKPQRITEKLYIESGDLSTISSNYAKYFKKFNNVVFKQELPHAWNSWYFYSSNINEEVILSEARKISERGINKRVQHVVIDDGYTSNWGDWEDHRHKFPKGLKETAKTIKDLGLLPGLWIAPFAAHKGSQILKEHPNWFLKDKDGNPASLRKGSIFELVGIGKPVYSLDPSHTEVINYLQNLFTKVTNDWGFEYLKLDYMYLPFFATKFADNTKTKSQSYRECIIKLKLACKPETFLLGCGIPLNLASGVFDAVRISLDVISPQISSVPVINRLNDVICKKAINNIYTRSFMDGHFFTNDPDCLIVRGNSGVSVKTRTDLLNCQGKYSRLITLGDSIEALKPKELKATKAFLRI